MGKTTTKGALLPPKIWKWILDTLEEVSDEIGEEDLGEGYLLKYEGWGGICVEKVRLKIEVQQKRKGIDILRDLAQEEREKAYYEYAKEQGYKIIDDEWKPELKGRGYCFIDGGYNAGGLYGRTWALFKKDV